jgi:hypothetical protein
VVAQPNGLMSWQPIAPANPLTPRAYAAGLISGTADNAVILGGDGAGSTILTYQQGA